MNQAPAMVKLLMRHGANARVGVHPHRDATTPRTMAIERGFQEIVTIIEGEEGKRKETTSAAGAQTTPRVSTTKTKTGVESAVRSAVMSGDTDWLRTRHAQRPLVNAIDWSSGGLHPGRMHTDDGDPVM
jgi:hypothetical protein